MARRNRYHTAWSDLLGVYARRSFAKNRTALCRGHAAPHQSASGGGHPRHYRSCPRSGHKDVSEHGRHRTAAGVWAVVLSPRARACPAKERTDTHLDVEDPPSQDALAPGTCPKPTTMPAPRTAACAVHSCKSPGSCRARCC